VFTVLTAVFGIGFLFDSELAVLPLLFGGLAALNFWTTRDVEEKLRRLYGEREALGALPAAPPFPSEVEKTILRHAYERQGRVYPQMLAINSDLSLAEIEHMLNLCVDKRLASIELEEKGRTYYYFSSLDDSDPYANLSGTPTQGIFLQAAISGSMRQQHTPLVQSTTNCRHNRDAHLPFNS